MFFLNASGKCLQFLCALLMSLSIIVYGIVVSWPSQTLPMLLSDSTPLPSGPISEFEASVLTSIFFAGGIVGAPFFGFTTDKFGRKWPIVVNGVIFGISCVLIAVATNVAYLYASRFLCGVAGAGIRTLIPCFYTEIAENRIRGLIGSISGISYSLGVVVGSAICDTMPFYRVPYVPIVLLGCFFLVTIFPDTPQSLLMQNRNADAEESLKFYRRNVPIEQVADEFANMKSAKDASGGKLTLQDFQSRGIQKILFLALILTSFCHFSGLQALGQYSVIILNETEASFNMNTVTTNFYILQLLGITTSAYLLDRLGRRLTMIFALTLNIVFLLIFGTYYYLLTLKVPIPQEYEWILIFAFYGISVSGIFVLNVPAVITNEICPTKLRAISASIIITLQWLGGIAVLQFFLPASSAFGIHTCVYFFATWTAIELFAVFLMMPETSGKSTEEIIEIFNEKSLHCCTWQANVTILKA